MATALLWALPGVAIYVILLGIASKRLSPERFEKAQKTCWIFLLFVGWLPRMLGDAWVVQLVTIMAVIGFPAVSAYVIALLVQQMRDASSSKSF